ncbi:MAG TPA: hypothetical protein VGV13_12865 [Methylomirabilota bacterium]|nr:hypothetical protein [Methylomirabilota bacterium]
MFRPLAVDAAGPWNGQIVDAETSEPLAGVVVLAYWIRYQPSLGGWAGGSHYASEEVVTRSDGRFTIRSRWAYTIPLIMKVSGPEFVVFKPGYGQWRFRSTAARFDKGELAVIEMPRLRTREERLMFYRIMGWAPVIPDERTARMREALEIERAFLDLRN